MQCTTKSISSHNAIGPLANFLLKSKINLQTSGITAHETKDSEPIARLFRPTSTPPPPLCPALWCSIPTDGSAMTQASSVAQPNRLSCCREYVHFAVKMCKASFFTSELWVLYAELFTWKTDIGWLEKLQLEGRASAVGNLQLTDMEYVKFTGGFHYATPRNLAGWLTLHIPRGVLWGPQRVILCDPAVTISTNLLLIFECVPHQLKINIM